MGFLGYYAITWLCFPPWPYMYTGCGVKQGTNSLSELVLLVCIAQPIGTPSSSAAWAFLWEWGWRLFGSQKNEPAPVAYPEEEGIESVCTCFCDTGCRQVRALLQGALAEGCAVCTAPDAPFVVLYQGLSAACGFQKSQQCVQIGNCWGLILYSNSSNAEYFKWLASLLCHHQCLWSVTMISTLRRAAL